MAEAEAIENLNPFKQSAANNIVRRRIEHIQQVGEVKDLQRELNSQCA